MKKRKVDSGQLTFDFSQAGKSGKMNVAFCRRAVVGWLAAQNPSGVGVQVPTRFSKYQADAAAFWSVPKRKRLVPAKTVIVEVRSERDACWPDCTGHKELLPKLCELKALRLTLEERIRRAEPHLRDDDNLFSEIEIWNYDRSRDREYHHCRKGIEEVEHALYRGSRFEQIRAAHVADFLYLAVPESTVHPHELADGWGLLHVLPGFRVDVVKEPESRDCPEENRFHLIQNIAASSMKHVLFAHGVEVRKGGRAVFLRKPRRRSPEVRTPGTGD